MKKYIILIPIYNDRESLTKLIENINSEIEGINSEISIVVINDASLTTITEISEFIPFISEFIFSINLVKLSRSL